MMIMGACLGALLCAFWAVCLWILWCLPRWSMNENYHEHVVASEFLIDKFRLDSWWFGLPLLLRGPLLSLPLLLFTNNPASQVVLMSLMLIIYVVLLSLAWPFKVPILNAVDAACTWALILLILGGSLHLPPMDEEMLMSAAVSTVGSIIFAAVAVMGAMIAVIWAGTVHIRKGAERRFGILDLAFLPKHDDLALSLQFSARNILSMDYAELSEQLRTLASFDVKLLHTSLLLLELEVVPEHVSQGRDGALSGKPSRVRSFRSSSSLRSASSLRSTSTLLSNGGLPSETNLDVRTRGIASPAETPAPFDAVQVIREDADGNVAVAM